MKDLMYMSGDSVLTARVLATEAEVESVRSVWTALDRNPEGDIDYFLLMLRLRPEIVRSHVLVVYSGGEPVGLVAGRIEESFLEVTSGNRRFWRSKVRRLAMFHEGLIGRKDDRVTAFVVRELLKSLCQEDVELMVWDGVHCHSPLHRALQQQPGLFCRDYLARESRHWIMRVPASLEELFQKRMNKKRRYWAKRTLRAVEKDFPGAVHHMQFSTPESVEQLWLDVTFLTRRSYQWTLGVGLQDTEEQRQRLEIAARNGWLYATVLRLGNQPAAYWICTRDGDSLSLDYTGFDPEFSKYEAGTVALFNIIEEMCKTGCKYIRFGGGSYAYKQKFGNVYFTEATILAFAPSFRGIRLNVLRLLTLGPVELIRRMAESFGLAPALKRLWQAEQTPQSELQSVSVNGQFNTPRISERQAKHGRQGPLILLWRLIFVVLVLGIIYLSWKSSPAITGVPWIPSALAHWFDQHDFIKNLSGYGAVALAGFMAWGGRLRDGMRFEHRPTLGICVDGKLLSLFFLLVVVMELGQLALPKRTCDWADVLAGWSGIGLAWIFSRLTIYVLAPGSSLSDSSKWHLPNQSEQ